MSLTPNIKLDRQRREWVPLRRFTAAVQGFLSFGASALSSFKNP